MILPAVDANPFELDPGLEALFFSFTQQAERRQMPRVEKVRSKLLRLLARLRSPPDRAPDDEDWRLWPRMI
jgi:hypothetical protein